MIARPFLGTFSFPWERTQNWASTGPMWLVLHSVFVREDARVVSQATRWPRGRNLVQGLEARRSEVLKTYSPTLLNDPEIPPRPRATPVPCQNDAMRGREINTSPFLGRSLLQHFFIGIDRDS